MKTENDWKAVADGRINAGDHPDFWCAFLPVIINPVCFELETK